MDVTSRPAWVKDAIFYQIFPDRFARSSRVEKPLNLEPWDAAPTLHGYKGGDLLGVAERLDWLQNLGVNAIYLNPIFQSASNHRYHTHDYFTVDPMLGGNEGFDELLTRCHERGIRVVIDGVFNHSSRGFFQFNDVLENGPGSPYTGWFHIHSFPLHPYSQSKPAGYEAWWGIRALPKFNTDNPEAREFLMRVGEHWARKGIDGWRLDVPEEITTPGFWEEFRERVRVINPDLYIVGEIWHEADEWIGSGLRFDGTMNYVFTSAAIAYAVGDRLDHSQRLDNPWYNVAPPLVGSGYQERIDRMLARYPEAASLSNLNLLDSHDTARILTLASGDVESVVLALVLLLTFPGAPSIYYGTEVGLSGGRDPDCRRAFPWGRDDSWNTELLQTVRELTALRRAHPALRSGNYRSLWPGESGGDGTMVYAFERSEGEDRIVGIVNAGTATESHSIPYDRVDTARTRLLWGHADVEFGHNQIRLTLPPKSASIWRM